MSNREKFPKDVVHIPSHFPYAVNTCWEAALSRNIHLESELKSLILEVDSELYAFHGTGNRKLNIKSLGLKDVSKIKLVSNQKLEKIGLIKGSINPFNIRHLNFKKVFICSSVLELNRVYTNDGTANGTIHFSPIELFKIHDNITVDFFSCEISNVFDAPSEIKSNRNVYPYVFESTSIILFEHNWVFRPTTYANIFLSYLKKNNLTGKTVCDVGSGSGVFGIFLAKSGACVTAIDVNPYAIMATKVNARRNDVFLKTLHSNCFEKLQNSTKFDFIVCNPPTLPDRNINEANDSLGWSINGDGRMVLDTVLKQGKAFLHPGGKLLIASSSQQDWSLTELLVNMHWEKWHIVKSEILELSSLYLPYVEEWLKKKLVFRKGNRIFHKVQLIELTK